MSFNRVKLSESGGERRSFKQAMYDAATYEPKRSMSNKRLIGSGLSLLLGISLAYASMFYVPAFVNVVGVLGFATQEGKLPVIENSKESSNFLKPYSDIFKLRRGYFRAGQILEVGSAMSPGSELMLTIQRCDSFPVIEIFHCGSLQSQTVTVSNPESGIQLFKISQPGFYYYSENSRNTDDSVMVKPYAVVWRRHHK